MSLVVTDLSKVYGKGKHQETAIKLLSVTIQQGEFVGILGRSGAGKSTFIRCINRLVDPTQGEVIWNNHQMTRLGKEQLIARRREIGMIFQQFHLIPRLTVLQNALLGCFGGRATLKNLLGFSSVQEKEAAMESLRRVGLDHLALKRVDQLSGGQQQRVAIARVLMQKPKLLLGDEPVASLDPITSKQIMSLIKEIHDAEQMTTIINLHDVQLALAFCDRIIGLSKGELVFDGLPQDVTDEALEKIYA
jgi:phosphonate transport system ATP-binding protein